AKPSMEPAGEPHTAANPSMEPAGEPHAAAKPTTAAERPSIGRDRQDTQHGRHRGDRNHHLASHGLPPIRRSRPVRSFFAGANLVSPHNHVRPAKPGCGRCYAAECAETGASSGLAHQLPLRTSLDHSMAAQVAAPFCSRVRWLFDAPAKGKLTLVGLARSRLIPVAT